MIFKTLREARDWFLKYKPLTEEVISFCYKHDHTDWEFGDWILFQHITHNEEQTGDFDKQLISRPILAIFTNFKIWDQALVINYVQPQRAWMRSHEVYNSPESKYTSYICELDDEVEAIQFWTDDIKVLGHWKHKPTIAQLKLALKK